MNSTGSKCGKATPSIERTSPGKSSAASHVKRWHFFASNHRLRGESLKPQAIAAALAALCISAPATAGIFADDLSRCLVAKTSEKDKATLVRWMFATLSLNPEVADISSMNDETRNAINKGMGELVQRLITQSCREQTLVAIKSEGGSVLGTSFEVFGQAAAQSMLANPTVGKAAGAFTQHLDKKAFEELGLPTQ